MSNLAAKYDITIDRGTDYNFVLTILNSSQVGVDVSGATFVSSIRDSDNKHSIVVFSVDKTTGGALGNVTFSLSDTQTKLLYPTHSYEYDIFMTIGTTTSRLLYGSVSVRTNRTTI